MAALLKNWLRRDVPISVIPFAPTDPVKSPTGKIFNGWRFDFVYVSSGEAHKNHMNLVEAWRLLAASGCRPSLALTLDTQAYPELCTHISRVADEYALTVTNLGLLSKEAVNSLYQSVGAMIYPSTTESFGLPLIEAAKWGLPILAPELDYVRDVVNPTETFDPNSPVSIARAVSRFLGVAEKPIEIRTAAAFLEEVLR
ncbi:glycosyltransferase [Thauera humireducens]|uniref:glycosyltransferase n=1 Tax=Thauera humireducens TaxID=1134435 RepID=UPI0014721073|nr:glycosyltransferase [Thauera humireducens]